MKVVTWILGALVANIAFTPGPAFATTVFEPVSMVELLANRKDYLTKHIVVAGYLSQGMNLYLTKDHANMHDKWSSIVIGDTPEMEIWKSKCLNSYVEIRGRLMELEPRILTLIDIEMIFQASTKSFCWTRP